MAAPKIDQLNAGAVNGSSPTHTTFQPGRYEIDTGCSDVTFSTRHRPSGPGHPGLAAPLGTDVTASPACQPVTRHPSRLYCHYAAFGHCPGQDGNRSCSRSC